MNPTWDILLINLAATVVLWAVATVAARIRFSASRGVRIALDVLFLLPLLYPSRVVLLLIFYFCAILGFQRVDRETIDAARLQGLRSCGIFWRVFFPVAWPWLIGGLVLGCARSAILLVILYA
ncbi:MAG: hypothetical protein PHQ12_03290 [Chthoniobacteraceae bacterium]|nr:hypothetical protein [Chthoniobacteraceae bacterium]